MRREKWLPWNNCKRRCRTSNEQPNAGTGRDIVKKTEVDIRRALVFVAYFLAFLTIYFVYTANLHYAASGSKHLDNVNVLIDAGADPNARSNDGWTPLHRAARSNENADVFKVLLKAGADPNAKKDNNWTPLHLAATNIENPDIVRMLIDAGAYLAAQNNEGFTPLDLAVENNDNPEIARILRNAGATRTKTVTKTEPEPKQGTDWGKVAIGVLGGAAIVHAGKDAPSEVTEQALADWINVMTEKDHSTDAPTSSGAKSPQSQGAPAQDQMQQALLNLENICGEKYRSGFAANDHYRFYCLATFNDYCALKRAPNKEARTKLRASLARNCAVLNGIGAAGKCSYCN